VRKTAYSVQLTYDLSDDEKAQAEKALLAFDYASKFLRRASEHLNIMLTPFKDNPDISPEEIVKFRTPLRRFRDKAIENFNQFKIAAFKCVSLMQMFSSDTQSSKLTHSFVSSVENIEKQVNKFSALFEDLKSKDFVQSIITSITDIQKETDELQEIIEERIKEHLQTNILGKTWVDGVSQQLQMNIEKKTPLLIELEQKRQQELTDLNNQGKR
jgi:hypothetical protein